MNEALAQIIYNILGGAIVSALTYAWVKALDKYSGYKFKNIFGQDIKNFYIVYGIMYLVTSYDEQKN
jgi:chromosome condensin MukBEF MukE localization factor